MENRKNPEDTVFHSKAVGEPPFMLGIAAWCAIKDAVASLADYRVQPAIDAPATPERVLWGCEQMRKLSVAVATDCDELRSNPLFEGLAAVTKKPGAQP